VGCGGGIRLGQTYKNYLLEPLESKKLYFTDYGEEIMIIERTVKLNISRLGKLLAFLFMWAAWVWVLLSFWGNKYGLLPAEGVAVGILTSMFLTFLTYVFVDIIFCVISRFWFRITEDVAETARIDKLNEKYYQAMTDAFMEIGNKKK